MTIIDGTDAVRRNAEYFANILPRIPYVLRKNIKTASCYKGSGVFLTDLSSIQIALKQGATEEAILYSIVHELGDSIDRGYRSSGYTHFSDISWAEAKKNDIFTVSDYAAFNSIHECFAEFCRFYFTGYTIQDWARALEILCPNQYKLFKQVRMDYLDGYTLWDDGPEKKVTVTLDYNDDGKTESKKIEVDQYSLYSENIKKLLEEPVWEGHKFLGWFTEVEGGKLIDEKQRVINENEHTIYAHWEDTNIYPQTVTLNKIEITLTEGENAELKATIKPDNAI